MNRYVRDVIDAARKYVGAVHDLRSLEVDDEAGEEEYETAGTIMDDAYDHLEDCLEALDETERDWRNQRKKEVAG